MQIPGWVFSEFISLSLRWGQKFCISNQASGDVMWLIPGPCFESHCIILLGETGKCNSQDPLSRNNLSQVLGLLLVDSLSAASGIALEARAAWSWVTPLLEWPTCNNCLQQKYKDPASDTLPGCLAISVPELLEE